MQINHNDFVGKTIESMDTRAVNEVVFCFTDGTSAALETECVLPTLGLYGINQTPPCNCGTQGCDKQSGPGCTSW